MKRKRLDRDLKWGFQYFPYYQMRLEHEIYHGLVSLIKLTDGEYFYLDFPKAGRTALCGEGMVWLQLFPDSCKRLITAMFLPKEKVVKGKRYPYSVSAIYVDVAEGYEYDIDGVAAYIDKYLDVWLTPQGDILIDDRDELDEAFNHNELTKKQYNDALAECDSIVEQMGTDIEETEKRCCDILSILEMQIAQGLTPLENRISRDKNRIR